MHEIADPLPSLTVLWLTLACWQTFAMFLGANIWMSKNRLNEQAKLCILSIFCGVMFGQWSVLSMTVILLLFCIGVILDSFKSYNKYEILRRFVMFIIMAAIAFFSKSVSNEVSYFIVNVYLGSIGMELLSIVL